MRTLIPSLPRIQFICALGPVHKVRNIWKYYMLFIVIVDNFQKKKKVTSNRFSCENENILLKDWNGFDSFYRKKNWMKSWRRQKNENMAALKPENLLIFDGATIFVSFFFAKWSTILINMPTFPFALAVSMTHKQMKYGRTQAKPNMSLIFFMFNLDIALVLLDLKTKISFWAWNQRQ